MLYLNWRLNFVVCLVMVKLTNSCWICGSPANSGEHIPKASNLKDLFGNVTQQKPLYFNSKGLKNKPLQSINSTLLKLRVLCSACNNSRTQNSDLAWDEFNSFLTKNSKCLKPLSKISFNKVYKYNSRKKALSFHLYAVKLFGCIASEFGLQLDLIELANSILRNKPNQYVYIAVGPRNWRSDIRLSGPSDLIVKKSSDGNVVAAVWFLVNGFWQYQFIYAIPGVGIAGLASAWNPKLGNRFNLKTFLD